MGHAPCHMCTAWPNMGKLMMLTTYCTELYIMVLYCALRSLARILAGGTRQNARATDGYAGIVTARPIRASVHLTRPACNSPIIRSSTRVQGLGTACTGSLLIAMFLYCSHALSQSHSPARYCVAPPPPRCNEIRDRIRRSSSPCKARWPPLSPRHRRIMPVYYSRMTPQQMDPRALY